MATSVLLVVVGLVRSERVWRVDFPIRAVAFTVVASVAVCGVLLGLSESGQLAPAARFAATAALLAASAAAALTLLLRTVSALRSAS